MFLLLSLLISSAVSAKYYDKKDPNKGVFNWLKALGSLKKYKITFLGIVSNGEDLDVNQIVAEAVPNIITPVNLTQIIYDNLGELTKPPKMALTEGNSGDDQNLQKLESLVGSLNFITKYISVDTANKAIGSLWGYLNSSISVLVFFCVALLLFLVQLFGCCCCLKARDHKIPTCLTRFCFSITASIILISAIFFLMGITSLININSVISNLDTEVISDLCIGLDRDLERVFSDNENATGSIYSIFLEPINEIKGNITKVGKILTDVSAEIKKNATKVNTDITNIINAIKDLNENEVKKMNTAFTEAGGSTDKVLNFEFDFTSAENGLSEALSEVDNLEKDINEYTSMVTDSKKQLDDLLSTFLNLKDDKVKPFMDTIKEYTSKDKKTYASGIRHYFQIYEENFKLIMGLYIFLGALLIVSIFIFYACFCTFCSLSRCCSSSVSVCPLLWSIFIVALAFVLTFFGLILWYVGSIFEPFLDNGLQTIAGAYFPGSQLVFPTIYLGPYTDNLIEEEISITWKVNPQKIKIFQNLGIVDGGSYSLVDLFEVNQAFNLSALGETIYDSLFNISERFRVPEKVTTKLNEALSKLNDGNLIKNDLNQYLPGKNFESLLHDMESEIDKLTSPSGKITASNLLKEITNKVDNLIESYAIIVRYVREDIPYDLRIAVELDITSGIRKFISSVGWSIYNALPLIYKLLNTLSTDQLVKYYPAIKNPIAYDIPYLAANLSLSAHIVLIGFFSLVLLMWVHRKDQLSKNAAKKLNGSDISDSSSSSSSYSNNKPVKARKRTRISSSSSSSNSYSKEKKVHRKNRRASSSETSSSFGEEPATKNTMVF